MVKVSVVIVNYNGANIIPVILDSLKTAKLKGGFETIVVDNASVDNSIEVIKKYKDARLVRNKVNLGYTGINSALQYCKGRYIYFTNNDLALGKNCLAELTEVLDKNEDVGIACSKVINYYDKKLQSCGTWVSRCFYNGHFRAEKDYPKQIPYNGVAMVRKSILEKYGYIFDKDYFIYAEDLDLCLRARLLGYKVIHVPTAKIYHMHSTTMGKGRKFKSTFMMERNLLTTFFKIFSFGSILLFLPYALLMRCVGMIKDILTLNFQCAAARISAILYVILNFWNIMGKRSQVQKMRKAGDKFVLEAFSEKYLFSKDKINV